MLAECINRAHHEGRRINIRQAIAEVEQDWPSHASELRAMQVRGSRHEIIQ
ncbi:hypothetical protein MCP1_370005 [Candidatus Terasakiella magnetica]|nr:hypothetical protein MCP1_370005 [Candidatus Terasakiella magnetica]